MFVLSYGIKVTQLFQSFMVFVDSHQATSLPSQDPAYTITEYFAKSCGHCQKMEPVWAQAKSQAGATQLGNNVQWVQKECYGDGWAPGKDLQYCQSQGVEAFPTIKLVKNGTDQEWDAPPLSGATVTQKAEQLLQFVESKAGNAVKARGFGQESLVVACAEPITDGQLFRDFL
jgi:hypothetical protein